MLRLFLVIWCVLDFLHSIQPADAVVAAADCTFSPRRQSQEGKQQQQRGKRRRHGKSHNFDSIRGGSTAVQAVPAKGSLHEKSSSQVSVLKKPSLLSSSAWLDGLKSGLASGMAAGCCKTLLQPIDAIKTAQQYSRASGSGGLNVVQACQHIMSRPGGVGNFYAGLGVTVLGSMPSVALYFGVYSSVKKMLLSNPEYSSTKTRKSMCVALAAAIGNTVASFSRVPYEVVKQQLQTNAYTSTWQALTAIAASPQRMQLIFPPGGVAIQMIRDVPYAVVTLLLYETLQSYYAAAVAKSNDGSSNTRANDFVLGGIAGGFGSWVTNPFDVIKTRLQTDIIGEGSVYKGSVSVCAQAVWQEGGAMAFLRGSVPRLMHKVPANAFFFLFYEFFKRVLRVDDTGTLH